MQGLLELQGLFKKGLIRGNNMVDVLRIGSILQPKSFQPIKNLSFLVDRWGPMPILNVKARILLKFCILGHL